MNDGGAYAFGLFAGFFVGALIFFFIGVENPGPAHDFEIICEYEGGTTQGDVCIKDDRVITIDIKE